MDTKTFIGIINLELNKQGVDEGIKKTGATMEEVAGKPITFPWVAKAYESLKKTSDATKDFSSQLEGFNVVSAKSNEIFKEGESVGRKTAVTFRNFAGDMEVVTREFDKDGKLVSQSMQSMGQGAALGAVGVKDFSGELEGFSKISTKINTIFEQGNEVGMKSVETYKNQEGALKAVTMGFDKQGNIVSQSLQETQKQAEAATYAVKDFSTQLQGFTLIGSKTTSIFKANNEETKQSIDIYRNQSGAIRQVTTDADKNGKVTGQSLRDITKGATQSATMMEQLGMAMKRALIVAPVWMIMRGAIQALMVPVKELIKAFFELETGLAKVMTVSRISASEQNKFYGELTEVAWKYYKTSSASMKEITEAMYQIGTAGRSTAEILQGFTHVLNLSIATFGNVTDAGRVLTGILNVYGGSLGNLITAEEKMRYISDLLVDTWSRHQVELNEISTAIGYVGSVSEALDIDLKTLVGTIGFLNDGLLRGSKAGTSLLNTFVQLAKSPEKLRDLGVVFDPRKPLDLVDVMQQLHNRFIETGKSVESTGDMYAIFGNRGAKAVERIIQNWDKWIESIQRGDEEFQKFAERTKKTAEETLPKAFAKFLKLGMMPSFPSKGKNPLTEWLNEQSDAMIKASENLELYYKLVAKGIKLPELPTKWVGGDIFGRLVGFVPEDLAKKLEPIKEFLDLIGVAEIEKELGRPIGEVASNLMSAGQSAKVLLDQAVANNETWEQMADNEGKIVADLLNMTDEELKQNSYLKEIYEYRLKNKVEVEKEGVGQRGLSSELKRKLELQEQEVTYSLAKMAGMKDEEITYAKIANKVNYLNKLASEANKSRKAEGKEIYQMVNLSDVLSGNWKKIQESGSTLLDEDKDIVELDKMRNDLQIQISQHVQQQVSLVSSVYRFMGLQESSIIKQEMIFKAIMNGEKYIVNSEEDRLRLAQALSAEMTEQERKSSSLVELYKIAKQYGMGVAQEVSNFLGGILKFSELSAGAISALRRNIPGEYEQGIAGQYLGTKIKFPEEIEKARIATRNISLLNQIMVEPMTVNVNLDSQGITAEILKKIAPLLELEFEKKGSSLNNVLHKEINIH